MDISEILTQSAEEVNDEVHDDLIFRVAWMSRSGAALGNFGTYFLALGRNERWSWHLRSIHVCFRRNYLHS